MTTSLAQGTIRLLIAQIIFLLTGIVIQLGLGRLFGPGDYGVFSVTINLTTICYMLITSGIPLAASRNIAIQPECAGLISSKSVRLHSILTIAVTAFYFLSSYPIALALGDLSLVPFLQISSLVVPFYGYYALYTNYHNGAMQFKNQSLAMITLSITKMIAVFGLVAIGFAVGGALIGYLFGAAFGFAMAWQKWRPDIPKSDCMVPTNKATLSYAIPIIVFSVCMTLLMGIDLLVVKSILQDDAYAGFYASALTIAKLPYFILSALSFSLFPSIAKAVGIENWDEARRHIKGFMRYLLMMIVPITAILSMTSHEVLILLYGSEFSAAGESLSILLFGYAFLTIFYILVNSIQASGSPRVALGLTIPLVPLSLILGISLVPYYQLSGAAYASLVSFGVGLGISAIHSFKLFGSFIEAKTIARILGSTLLIGIIGTFYIVEGWLLSLKYAGLVGLYILLLIITRETTKGEIQSIIGAISSSISGRDL